MAVAYDAEGGQNAHGAEHGRGGADGSVGRVVKNGVDQVAQNPGGEQQAPPQARTEVTGQTNDEDAADQHVAEQVLPVGVQGQRGNQAPQFAVEDPAGMGVAQSHPVDGMVAGEIDLEQGDVVKGGQKYQNGDCGHAVVGKFVRLRLWRRPVAILFFVAAQFVEGAPELPDRHQQMPAGLFEAGATGDAAGLEHQRPVAQLFDRQDKVVLTCRSAGSAVQGELPFSLSSISAAMPLACQTASVSSSAIFLSRRAIAERSLHGGVGLA